MRGYAWTSTDSSVGRKSILSRRVFTLSGKTGLQESVFAKKQAGYGLHTYGYWILHKYVSGTYYWTGMVVPYRKKGVQEHSGKNRQIETTYVGHVPDMSKFKQAHRKEKDINNACL